MVTAAIKGKKLIIEVDMEDSPKPSSSGKTKIVASSHGNQTTTVLVEGKPVVIGVNAYIKN